MAVLGAAATRQLFRRGGAIDFGTLTFTKEGIYVFTINELDLGAEEIIYDQNAVTVTVVVEINGGRLKIVSVTYSKGGEAIDGIRFANKIKSIVLPEEDRPLTGDSGSLVAWMSLMLLSTVCFGCLATTGFRRKKLK